MITSRNSNEIRTFRATLTLMLTTLLVTFCLTGVAHAAGEGVFEYALRTEPPNLDTTKATDQESFFILGHTMEGLTQYGPTGKIVPAVAEKWEINDKTATFHLRKNAKWSDGKPVTAKDFVYSWQVALDPKTASEYAFILYHLKNGEKINKGQLPVTDLGVKAIDDYTLQITFEKPCGYFLALTTFATYNPIREDFHKAQGPKYAANAENLLFNGAYKLVKWTHGASLRMEKNEQYWDKNSIHIAVINVPFITPDATARFNLFKSNKIDLLTPIDKDSLANAQRESFKLSKFADGSLFYMQFNFRKGRITSNKNLRKAIQAIFNPTEYVGRVVGIPGTQPGVGLVPQYMMGVNKPFRKEFPLPPQKQNLVAAKKFLADALKELNLTKAPSLVWVTGDTPLAVKEAEYFQSIFKSTLGIDLKIDKQIFKQRLAKQRSGDFDIVSAGWGPDYADPMTFADLFTTWNDNNNGRWASAEYDQLIRKASDTTNQKVRMDLMAQAEKLLMEELPIVPMYERTVMYTHSPRVEGIIRRAVGFDPVLLHARMIK